MIKKDLVFRGIRKEEFHTYFGELDGKRKTETFPIVYEGDNWRAELVSEEIIKIATLFEVNEIPISIYSETEEELNEFIKRLRRKTTRVGG